MSIDELELASPSAKILKPSVQDLIGRPKPRGYPNGPILENGQSPLSQRINSLTREARKESLSELREFTSYYKEGVATLQDYIIETILDYPDISLDELDSILDQFRDELGISRSQYHLFRYILSEYSIRHKEIEDVRQKYTTDEGELDESRLFRDSFGFANHNDVFVLFSPIAISFVCTSLTDFASAYDGEDVNKLDEEKRSALLASTKTVGGAFLASSQPLFDYTLIGSMILINTQARPELPVERSEDFEEGLSDSLIGQTIAHEEEHSITNFLIRSARSYIALKFPNIENIPPDLAAFTNSRPQRGSIDNLRLRGKAVDIAPQVRVLNRTNIEMELKRVLLDQRREPEELIKQEVLSFLVQGNNEVETRRIIENYTPTMDWMQTTINEYTKIVGEERRDIVERQVYSIFNGQLNSLSFRAIQALYSLEGELNTSKAIALLRMVPLRRWPAEAERIIRSRDVR